MAPSSHLAYYLNDHNMKAITPRTVWKDGIEQEATQLSLTIKFDNLDTEAVFTYVLSDDENTALVTGSIPIEGDDYQTWGQSTDANTDAYAFAARQLNLEFA